MRPGAAPLAGLGGEEILRAWEAAAATEPLGRSAAVLREVLTDLPVDAAALPVGRCDTLLLALRVGTFGSRLSGVSSCPACDADVDVDVDIDAVLSSLPPLDTAYAEEYELQHGGYTVRHRLPTTADLLAAADADDPAVRIAQLCVRTIEPDGVTAVAELPPEMLAAISEQMAAADPAADIRLGVSCPECASEWSAPLDITTIFDAELTGAARQIIAEIDQLASRYGWSEQQILALSPTRRRTYLELR
ncbi:hypothetical protein Mycsm_06567 (plasmid) [Mycobacterium sp. JS623]|uniref:T4 family baseplate hub assembly chaperone n=1 Tax=Mycobacterium sp. JS623 TaxID=212767 RepID=UPI0002A5AFA8|nr:hypothetical protein [Mycobacterium sp. JS623]AGB26704.1 hypothetical protein Mycsm_06567 [Mycobacterium sp. JS623]